MKMSITEITNDDFDDESEGWWNLHIFKEQNLIQMKLPWKRG